MTTATKELGVSRFGRLLSRIGAVFVAVFNAIDEASEGARRARYAERLFEMSDAELAKRGLTRDGIIQHAFRGWV